MLNNCNFSFKHYREILEKLRDYKFCFFNDDFEGKRVYLRHDIDYSPEQALKLAKNENELGICSTFFVRFSPFYDILDSKYPKIIKNIAGLGHQFGLHFDKGDINEQLKILENNFGAKRIVSFHRPSESEINKEFEGFTSTYEPRFFRDIKYLSDSKGNWREGCICEQKSLPQVLHINMHPIWWDEKEGDLNPKERLEEYAKTKNNITNLLKNDNTIFRP